MVQPQRLIEEEGAGEQPPAAGLNIMAELQRPSAVLLALPG